MVGQWHTGMPYVYVRTRESVLWPYHYYYHIIVMVHVYYVRPIINYYGTIIIMVGQWPYVYVRTYERIRARRASWATQRGDVSMK